MKKNFKVCLLGLCMVLLFSGCAAKTFSQNAQKKEEDQNQTEEDLNQDEETETETENEGETGEGEETEEEPEVSGRSDGPVLGQTGIEDYDGFEYLYCEKLRTQSEKDEDSGKMKSAELSVFIPNCDYTYVNMQRTSGNDYLGVSFEVELNPSIRYKEDDYLPEENLDYKVESAFDPFYYSERKDVDLTKAEKVADGTYMCEAKFCNYDEYYDKYSPIYVIYLLKELDEDRTVYVEIEVNTSSTTGKTPMLLEELEQFYEIDIQWDKEEMEKKLEDFLANGGDNTFSTGYLLFELPEGWKEDRNAGDYKTTIYAPGGDAANANCMIGFADEYVGYDVFAGVSNDTLVSAVKEYMEEDGDTGADVSYYGETCLGPAVLAIVEENTSAGKVVLYSYWIFDRSNMYTISAVAVEGAEENPFLVVEGILENGQVRED